MDRRIRGRDPELETIGELVAETARGRGGLLLIEGPTGAGRSRIVAETQAIARRAGLHVAAAEAFEGQRMVPFVTLLTALLEGEHPVWNMDGLDQLRGRPEFAYWLVEELHEVLEAAALQRPLLILLDDLHHADAGTLAALRTLVPSTSGLPIRWVFALRRGRARTELRELIARLRDAQHLRLAPLSEDAVAEIIADRLGAAGEPELLRLAASARGNAFLLVELLEGLREEGRVTVDGGLAHVSGDALPARLTESMRERLDRLAADARQVVQTAAVLGQRFTAEQLATVLDRRPSRLLEPIDEALRSDLLHESGDRLSFRHEILRQSVLQTLTRSMRRELQREAAAALLEHGAEPVQVAAQVAESAEHGDEAAIAHLRQAARCLSAVDADAAADMSVRALELAPAGSEVRGTLVAETLALLYAALRDGEADALAAVTLNGSLPAEAEGYVRLSLSTRLMGRDLVSAEENRRALRLPGISPRLRALNLAWLTCTLANAGLVAEAEENAGHALAAADQAGDPSARAMATVGIVSIAVQRGQYFAALDRIGELEQLAKSADDHVAARFADFQRADVLAALGRMDEAMRVLQDGLARGREERRAWVISGWVATAAHMHYLAGTLTDVRANAEAAEALRFPLASHVGGAAAMLARFQFALHTGDRAHVRAGVRIARRVSREAGPAVRRHAAWMLALAADDPLEAVRWLNDDELPYAVPFLPSDPAYHVQVVRIALAAEERALAGRAVAVAEEIERANPAVALLEGLASHARGLLHDDPLQLERAVALLEHSQRPLPHASALEDMGRALGDAERLNQAHECYLATGATEDAARVARRLRRFGIRQAPVPRRAATGWESLTESELRVVRLVGAGSTNRDTARRLSVSPHTVSSHLRHAFAKLKINSRVELARVLHEQDVAAPAG